MNNQLIFGFIIIGAIIFLLILIISVLTDCFFKFFFEEIKDNDTKIIDDNYCNNNTYIKKDLLTQRELNFYIKLKKVIDEYNLWIICKIRLADIVEPNSNLNKNQWYSAFAKVSQKHIDFAIVEPQNMRIFCLIELDDSTHYRYNRKNRDNFINDLFKQTNIKLIRTWGDLKEIENILKYSYGKKINF